MRPLERIVWIPDFIVIDADVSAESCLEQIERTWALWIVISRFGGTLLYAFAIDELQHWPALVAARSRRDRLTGLSFETVIDLRKEDQSTRVLNRDRIPPSARSRRKHASAPSIARYVEVDASGKPSAVGYLTVPGPGVAPETAPKKPRSEVRTEVAPESAPDRKPRPEVVTEVAPGTMPRRPEVVTEVAPWPAPHRKPRPEVVTEVAPETAPRRPDVVTEVAPETDSYRKPRSVASTGATPDEPSLGRSDAAARVTARTTDNTVTRTPHMDLVGAVPLSPGRVFKVRVYADALPGRPGEDTTDISVVVPAATTTLDLEVWIAGTEQFEFPGVRVKSFVIDLQSNAVPSAEFDIKVRDTVATSVAGVLFANFSYQGRPSGRVAIKVDIVVDNQRPTSNADKDAGVAPPPRIFVDVPARPADLTIEVTDPQNTKQHLQCRLWSPHLDSGQRGEPFPWHLDRDTAHLVKTYMKEFVRRGLTRDERLLNLQGAGRQLWDATPQRLKDTFWTLRRAGKLETIQVVSEEPFLPWELMIPRQAGTTLGALGTEFLIGRWLPRDFVAAPQQLALARSLVVAPNYGSPPDPKKLAFAPDEAKQVLEAVPGDLVEPATSLNVRHRLALGGATLVHFVCHGKDSRSFGIQSIALEASQLTSLQLSGLTGLPAAFACRPLVFLNACEIGRLVPALVGVGGFAKAFLDAGAGGVIAPLWSVKDSCAHDIAQAFYDRLKTEGHVRPAEILRDIRRKTYSTASPTLGEDTYAAYCFYGDANAVAYISGKPEPDHGPVHLDEPGEQ